MRADRSSTPMVSVGMPVFNGARFLRESIESVLAQTYPDFELLISDNASTDDTARICREYAKQEGRIRYIRQKTNIGALGNFERVLGEARGQYFMWMAADDLISPTWIEHLVRNARETDFGVYGEYQYISESGEEQGVPALPRHLRLNSQLTTFMLPDSCGKCFYMYSLFRRAPLASMRIFAEKAFLGNDQIIILRLLEHGDLRAIPGAVMRYRIHPANTSATEGRERGGYRRALFSTFPATYYRHALTAVPRARRAQLLLLVPPKYLFEQTRSYKNFLGGLFRKVENSVRNLIDPRRSQAARG